MCYYIIHVTIAQLISKTLQFCVYPKVLAHGATYKLV